MNMIRRGAMVSFALGLMSSGALTAPAPVIQIETLYSFNPAGGGLGYPGGLIVDDEGNIYGETSTGPAFPELYLTIGGSAFSLIPPTKGQHNWTKTILHSFTGTPDGTGEVSIVYSHGKIYGSTDFGGAGYGFSGAGIVFSLTPTANGPENILYTFCPSVIGGTECGPGSGGYTLAVEDGVIYGTTPNGLFKLSPPAKGQSVWTESIIYSQDGLYFSGPYFGNPCCSSILVNNGAIYVVGTVVATNQNMLLKFTSPPKGQTSWTKTVLYTFADTGPSSLIPDHQGGFYGTTYGSTNGNSPPFGTVFRLTPPRKGQSVWTNTVLYTFKGGPDDGGGPTQLVIDDKGSLYGITSSGGNQVWLPNVHGLIYGSGGTLFKLSPPTPNHTVWSETVYKFCSGQVGGPGSIPPPACIDGVIPTSLVADKGTIYGSTYFGGNFGDTLNTGTIFKVTSKSSN
jgi:hypothetical protein